MVELLSPAGNMDSFVAAINAGCNAIYLGGSKFGARAYADNFTDEEIIEGIKLAHLHGVKVYLTVNTLIKENEWDDCIDFIKPFYEAGLDACIIQDLGLISVFKTFFPKMECHVSTQAFATGIESVKYFKSLGAERVVLARELSADEIKYIKDNVDVELEVFIHGSMCYSYSGMCLLSSCLGGRSGNRGRCAGPCRLPLCVSNGCTLMEDGKALKTSFTQEGYYMSMKDQCTLEILPKIIESGADSLKIEGRMKKPEYTAFVTSIYRKYIDLYYKNPKAYKVEPKDMEAIKQIYLRSNIQTGYYETKRGSKMISIETPGYVGSNESLLKEIHDKYVRKCDKIAVTGYFYCHKNENMVLTLNYDDKCVSVEGCKVSESINKPVSYEDVNKQLNKLGDTQFSFADLTIDLEDDCFVPVKELNEIRRTAFDKLSEECGNNYTRKFDAKTLLGDVMIQSPETALLVRVNTIEQLKMLSDLEGIIFVLPVSLIISSSKLGISLETLPFYVELPSVIRKDNLKFVSDFIKKLDYKGLKGVIVNSYEGYSLCKDLDLKMIAGPNIYGFNKFSVKEILKFADNMILPYELSGYETDDLDISNAILTVYGKTPLMVSANCLSLTTGNCHKEKGPGFITIKDRKNVSFSVFNDCNFCINTVYNSCPTFLQDACIKGKINKYSHLLSFTDESGEEALNIFKAYNDLKNNSVKVSGNFTQNYWQRGVE